MVGLQGSAMCRVKLEDDRVIVRHFDQLRPRQSNGAVENTENDSDDSLVLEENGNSTEVPVAEQVPLSETEESVTTQSTVNAEGTADSSTASRTNRGGSTGRHCRYRTIHGVTR